MDISIVIPTFNRAGSLRKLLESLGKVDDSEDLKMEVIIVENGVKDDETAALVGRQSEISRFIVKYLHAERKGKANALNVGLIAASGRVLCVLDDDVVVKKDWPEKLWNAYSRTAFDAIQGRVLPGVDTEGRPADPKRLREYNIPIIDYGEKEIEIRGLIGTNMSFKREVFERVGLFDVRLGPGASGFSEDTEYSARIRKAGFKIGYIPGAVIYHELDPRRYGREYNRDVQYRKGLSRSVYRQDSLCFNVFPNLLANCIRLNLYRLFRQRQKAYKTEGRVWKYWGYISGKLKSKKFS